MSLTVFYNSTQGVLSSTLDLPHALAEVNNSGSLIFDTKLACLKVATAGTL